MPTDHALAVNIARKSSDEVGRLFACMGTAEHPRGELLAAYRVARRGLKGNIGNSSLVNEVLNSLQAAMNELARNLMVEAYTTGLEFTDRQLAVYDLPMGQDDLNTLSVANRTIMLEIQTQINRIYSAIVATGDEMLIIGDDERVGMLSPAPVARELSRWLAILVLGGISGALDRTPGMKDEFVKQAIAAIDDKTTDCCLQVHAQTQPMDKPFILTGTPRYADKLQWAPFHWYCRTGHALVRKSEAGDELTRQMEQSAKNEIDARATSGRAPIWPSHARSGR